MIADLSEIRVHVDLREVQGSLRWSRIAELLRNSELTRYGTVFCELFRLAASVSIHTMIRITIVVDCCRRDGGTSTKKYAIYIMS